MIEKVILKNFKRFEKQEFDIENTVVLAGPNNTGKTTLMQAIATWNFALNKWKGKEEFSPNTKNKSRTKKEHPDTKKRTGIAITREGLLSMPLRSLKLLWKDASTSFKKGEGKVGTPRFMYIILEGKTNEKKWQLTMEFYFSNPELIYARPLGDIPILPEENIVYVPSFSGIAVQEPIHAEAYQQWLIGQGKPGDIIRNLLLEIFKDKDENKWKHLNAEIKEIFGYELLEPKSSGQPFILCDYLERPKPKLGYGGLPKFDIANAGSGFLQTLTLLAFIYARPASVFLLDEPDAHLHVALQNQIYHRLQQLMQKEKSQLIIATHSEVLIDNTPANKIISFYNEPRILLKNIERNQVREALKKLSSMDITMSEEKFILYIENESDLNILQAWAKVLKHEAYKKLINGFNFSLRGRKPSEASGHFLALQALQKDMKGLILLDGDNREDAARKSSYKELEIHIWDRYEIENYLIHPDVINRIGGDILTRPKMENLLPPAIMKNPLGNHHYLKVTAASKELLPEFFKDFPLQKSDYYQIAEKMKPEEIHSDIKNFLDKLVKK